MSSEIKKKIELEIVHVLFLDIVGYSRRLTNEQRALVDQLNQVVRSSHEFKRAEAADRLIKIPTGDGMALVFYKSPEQPVECALEIHRALQAHPELRLRMGVHSGPVSAVVDVNGQTNAAGIGINIAQRVMDCGDSGHILISKRVAEDLEQYGHWQPHLHDLGEVEVKHGVGVHVFNLYTQEFGNPEMPEKLRLRKGPAAAATAAPSDAAGAAHTGSPGPEAAVPTIAVLPFADMSPEQDQGYFCDGICEEIINTLARIRGLHVASRVSSFGFKSTNANSRAIGERLGVGKLLEGSVRKAGVRLRISVQLIDVLDDSLLWSERYDRTLEDIFAIQEDIALSILQALKVTLASDEGQALRSAPTIHAAAYDLYLRGREFFYCSTRRDHQLANQMFTRAIEIDPSFARAWAGLADTNAYVYKHFERNAALLDQADTASAKALELDRELAEAHASRGVVHWLKVRYEEADREFDTAIRLDPTLYEAYWLYATSCYNRGKLEDAARLFGEASTVRPDDYQAPLVRGAVYRGQGHDRKATLAFRHGLALARRHLELHPDDARAWYLGAGALVFLGQVDTGIEWAERARQMDPENPLLFYNLAGIYGAAGRIDHGLDLIERAVQLGFSHKEGLEHDPDLAPLRDHPRYLALLARL